MKALATLSIFLVVLAAQASATGLVTVRSNARANVFLDGDHMGRTPMTITDIAPGHHKLTLIDPSTNNSQIYPFLVSKRIDIAKQVDATFLPDDPSRLVIQSGVNKSTGAREYRYENQNHSHRRGRNEHVNTSRNKVRVRNTALGVGALGVLTNSGPLKVLGFGGALVNELTNR